jgi:hypothetical protein
MMADTTLTDPLNRVITLHDHTWFGHILPSHPEMDSHRVIVESAITNPNEIHISDADPACRLYFAHGPRLTILVVVVANVTGGFVKTAHFVKSTKGALEWSKPTP